MQEEALEGGEGRAGGCGEVDGRARGREDDGREGWSGGGAGRGGREDDEGEDDKRRWHDGSIMKLFTHAATFVGQP